MHARTIVAIVIVALTFAVGSARAQDPSLRAQITSVSSGEYPNGVAVVNIEDPSGGLGELKVKDFTLTLAGAPVPVLSADLASSSDEPLDIIMMIDTSGSMEGAPLAAAKDAAKAFVGDLAADDRVAILTYASDVQMQLDYTSDRDAAFETIDGLAAWGGTVLFKATAAAAFKATESTAARRAIILLSDGAADASDADLRDDALGSAALVGVPFFIIAQGDELDREYLRLVADSTNGRVLDAPEPGDVRGLFDDIGRLLRDQYVVTFDGSSVAAYEEVQLGLEVRASGRSASDSATFRPDRSLKSVVSISGIEAGDAVDGVRQVFVTLAHSGDKAAVSFYVDDVLALESTTEPHVFRFDPAAYREGSRELRIVVAANGEEATFDVPFTLRLAPASSGGGFPLMPALIAAGAFVGLLAALFVILRSRRRTPDGVPVDQRVVPWAAQVAAAKQVAPTMPLLHADETPVEREEVGEPMGLLISRAGSDLGAEYIVGGTPVSIGSGSRCAVCVDDPSLASEEARIWVRNGHLMLHRITRLTAVSMDGTVGGWVILEPGDTFEIGQHRFEFRMIEQLVPAFEATADNPPADDDSSPVPNILRDRDGGDAPRLTDMMPPQIGGAS